MRGKNGGKNYRNNCKGLGGRKSNEEEQEGRKKEENGGEV